MVEALAGRLKWERTDNGIRVVIPARMSWGAIQRLLIDLGVYVVAFIGLFLITGCVAYLGGHSFRSFLNSKGVDSLYYSSLGCCAGLVLARMTKRLFGQTVVTLNPIRIAIEWNARLWHSKEVFPTETLYSFRFADVAAGVPVRNKNGQNEVQFSRADGIHSFGEGVSYEEAKALISKMMEVYPFPNHLLTASAAGAEPEQNAAFS